MFYYHMCVCVTGVKENAKGVYNLPPPPLNFHFEVEINLSFD